MDTEIDENIIVTECGGRLPCGKYLFKISSLLRNSLIDSIESFKCSILDISITLLQVTSLHSDSTHILSILSNLLAGEDRTPSLISSSRYSVGIWSCLPTSSHLSTAFLNKLNTSCRSGAWLYIN